MLPDGKFYVLLYGYGPVELHSHLVLQCALCRFLRLHRRLSVRSPENQKIRYSEETVVREIFQRDKTNEIIGENIMNYIFCSGDTA